MNSLFGGAAHGGLDLFLLGNIHVAQASQVLVSYEGDGELGLESGLIEAGESPAAVGSLHLGASQDAFRSVVTLVSGPVEASHLVVELTGEFDLELSLGALAKDMAVKVELGDLGGLMEGNLGGIVDSLSVGGQLGTVDVELERVEGDGAGFLGNIEVNDDGTVKGQLVEVGLESNVVMAGDDVGREQLAAVGATRSGTTASLVDTSLGSAHVVEVSSVRAVAKLTVTPAVGSERMSNWRGDERWTGAGDCGCQSLMKTKPEERNAGVSGFSDSSKCSSQRWKVEAIVMV